MHNPTTEEVRRAWGKSEKRGQLARGRAAVTRCCSIGSVCGCPGAGEVTSVIVSLAAGLERICENWWFVQYCVQPLVAEAHTTAQTGEVIALSDTADPDGNVTFLDPLSDAGVRVSTPRMRLAQRSGEQRSHPLHRATGSCLSSSIQLVCRPRPSSRTHTPICPPWATQQEPCLHPLYHQGLTPFTTKLSGRSPLFLQ